MDVETSKLTVPINGTNTTYDVKYAAGRSDMADIKAYLGYPDTDGVLGLFADFEDFTFTRLGEAVGKTPGSDFNDYIMYGGRKLCNLADDGTVNAWYGDNNYVEDGSNGQVMVYQPKFYYKIVPLKMEPIDIQHPEYGYSLKRVNYFVSENPISGFKTHPAFFDAQGNELDGIFISAYEGSIFDYSENKYLRYDDCDFVDGTYTSGVYAMDTAYDKFSSIAGVKPASGYTNVLNRAAVEQMCQNRGVRWHSENVQVASMEQLLFIIEYATFNSQNAIGAGVTAITSGTGNNACDTGSTASIGEGSGRATSTTRINDADGSTVTETATNKTSIRYRGRENDWGNMWDFVDGLTIIGYIPHYCSDFDYVENGTGQNYKSADIKASATGSTYVKNFGWSETCDWMFVPTETGAPANSTKPVGDYFYINSGTRIAYLGGAWYNSSSAGAFYWHWSASVGTRYRALGGRLACFYSPASAGT